MIKALLFILVVWLVLTGAGIAVWPLEAWATSPLSHLVIEPIGGLLALLALLAVAATVLLIGTMAGGFILAVVFVCIALPILLAGALVIVLLAPIWLPLLLVAVLLGLLVNGALAFAG